MAENTTPRFEGEKINLGGTVYTVPPLSLRQVRALATKIDKVSVEMAELTGMPQEAQVDALLDIVLAALGRNYPDMTKEQLLDLVDLGNMIATFGAVMRTSGLVPREGKAQPRAESP